MARSPNFPMRLHESLKTLYKLAASIDGERSLSAWLKKQADRRIEELIGEKRLGRELLTMSKATTSKMSKYKVPIPFKWMVPGEKCRVRAGSPADEAEVFVIKDVPKPSRPGGEWRVLVVDENGKEWRALCGRLEEAIE